MTRDGFVGRNAALQKRDTVKKPEKQVLLRLRELVTQELKKH